MKPYGLFRTPFCRCCYRDFHCKASRGREKEWIQREIADQLDSALHPAEVRLIECDAGKCSTLHMTST